MKIARHDIPLDLDKALRDNRLDFADDIEDLAATKRFGPVEGLAGTLAARLACLGHFDEELCRALNFRARVIWAMCATVENGGYEANFGVGQTQVLPRLDDSEIPTPRRWTKGIACAALTYDSYVIENLAKHPIALMEPARGGVDPMAFHYVEAWQGYLLGDRDRAYRAATETLATDATVNEEYSLNVLYPRAEMILRLIEGDSSVFNERLAVTLEAHKRHFEKGDNVFDVDGHLPVELVAIANLAKDAGMEVNVESDYLPMELVCGLCRS